MKKTTFFILTLFWTLCCTLQVAGAADLKYEYHLLATNKTSTMEKELGEVCRPWLQVQSCYGR